ncbi:MAG: (d)CMP kinase [Candidatus Poribacteria bacterium]|nr:(d)CMP kinase [Candidatus Poribacteria bacterium]
MTLAIDGPAGSGKSTVARRLAEKLNCLYLDSGAMYRTVTLHSIRTGVDWANVPELIRLVKSCKINFAENGKIALLDGEDVSDAIRTPEINSVVSDVSKIPELRQEIVKQQRRIGADISIVAEGRDVTTVVFPNADYKFFLTASVEARARRRFAELQAKGIDATLNGIQEEICDRDTKDCSREHSPLRTAEDAIVVNTTDMTIDQVVDFVLGRIRGL